MEAEIEATLGYGKYDLEKKSDSNKHNRYSKKKVRSQVGEIELNIPRDRSGGYLGGQAELLRVPYRNHIPFIIPESCELPDESVLFLSDVLPTAYWSVIHGGVKKGDTFVVLGFGPIGLMAQKFAWMNGAKRVIAVDHVPYRLQKAKQMNNVETINFKDIADARLHIQELTSGGADVVIDCVGMDGKKTKLEAAEQNMKLIGGTLRALKIAKDAVRKCNMIQLTGVYGSKYNQEEKPYFENGFSFMFQR